MRINYIKWNNLLGEFFFTPKNEHKIITLIISEEDLISMARKGNIDNIELASEKDIIDEFKKVWRIGYPGVKGNIIEKINQEDIKGKSFYDKGRDNYLCDSQQVNYPPTLLHLAGINLAIIESKNTSRYKQIRDYFEISSVDFPNMNEHTNWNKAWENLVWWTNNFKQRSYGFLPEKSLSSERFAYMGKPFIFILLSRSQLKDFFQYFFDQDFEPQSLISNGDISAALMKVKGNKSILNLLEDENYLEDQKLIFGILKQLFLSWNGELETNTANQQINTYFQSRKLKLCFRINNIGVAVFYFRFRDDVFTDTSIIINKQLITINDNYWSSIITIPKLVKKAIFKDETIGLKLVFKPIEDHLFVFKNGRIEGLNSENWIESESIQFLVPQYLILTSPYQQEIIKWIQENAGIEVTGDILSDEDNIWTKLFYFENGFKTSFQAVSKLKLPSTKVLHMNGGLKGNERGEYIVGFPLSASLDGAKGNEELVLVGPKFRYQYNLSNGNTFELTNLINEGEYTIDILGEFDAVSLPNNGKIKFLSLSTLNHSELDLPTKTPMDEAVSNESKNYNSALSLIKLEIFPYDTPPQFDVWKNQELSLHDVNEESRTAITLMEYLTTKQSLTKKVFSNGLSIIRRSLLTYSEIEGESNEISTFTLNALKEASRVSLHLNTSGTVDNIKPLKPWIFRLCNFQSFRVTGNNNAMKPFKGELYSLGGSYTTKLLHQIEIICKKNGATLQIYKEGTSRVVIPPSVFIYQQKRSNAVIELKELLCQSTVLPYYRYLNNTALIAEHLDNFMSVKSWEFHLKSRYQLFDTERFHFKRNTDDQVYPSLSLYELTPWEKIYILRFEKDGQRFEGKIESRWGKYMILYLTGTIHSFFFDKDENILFVPAALRLPQEIEDNLFFLTGRMPSTSKIVTDQSNWHESLQIKSGTTFLLYRGILKKTAEIIMENLGQSLQTKNHI